MTTSEVNNVSDSLEKMTTNPDENDYALNIKTVQGSTFKVLIEALKDLLTDTVLIVNEKGMKICTMDASHSILIHLKLDASKFEYYHCNGEQMLGIHMINLNKLIKTVNNNDTICFSMTNSNKNELEIKVENNEKNTYKISKLFLLDLDNTNMEIPPFEYSVITLPSSYFREICRDMAGLSDTVTITNTDNKLIVSCSGDFCHHQHVLKDGDSLKIESKNDEVIYRGDFDAKYLYQFTKCTNISNVVELYLKNDYPLICEYSVGSLGTIKLCLAPQQKDL